MSSLPRTCEYNFTVEHFTTLSRSCFNCPQNVTDCFRPHCISGDGVYRVVKVVNRMLPGPTINVSINSLYFKGTWYVLVDFPPLPPRVTIFYDFLFTYQHTKFLLKGNLPSGSKFFPFRVHPFLKWRYSKFDRVVFLETVSIPLKANGYNCTILPAFGKGRQHLTHFKRCCVLLNKNKIK